MTTRRTLIHVPIIHTQADMGALGERVKRELVRRFDQDWWDSKAGLIDRAWDEIASALLDRDMPWERVRVYQDGLPICGRELDIVKELAAAGSRNHRLVLETARRGATVVGTESGELLVEEYSRVRRLLGTSEAPAKHEDFRASGAALIEKRDRFIAGRIDATLVRGEIGILFLGMLHSVAALLPADIRVFSLRPFADNRSVILEALRFAREGS
ncbi:MAG: hypothetical protein WA005_11345 [Candidatus Binataceae bacterium]